MERTASVTAAAYGRPLVALPDAAESAAADGQARTRFGVPERVLMENAGRAAALVLDRIWPRGRVVGVAGSGNNGGDLLVMLRVLREWGRDVIVLAAGSSAPDSALLHGAEVEIHTTGAASPDLLVAGDVLVDGMLGTGASGAPRGRIAEMIDGINAAGRPVLALDLPSGVDASTGRVADPAIRAAVTVSFGWPKLGLLLHPARALCGRLVAVEIGFPPACMADVRAFAITSGWAAQRLVPRRPDSHKGTSGRLLVLAGSIGMAGAAAIAAEAAIRTGGGLIRIASAAANREILQTLVPEATFLDREHVEEDDVAPMHALVAGPGLGRGAAARAILEHVLRLMPERPALFDADALNVLADAATSSETHPLTAIARTRPLVITPHAGELSRLTGAAIDDIVADAPAAARDAARRFGCVVLLKGQPSIVAQPDGTLHATTVGSSDVATAGMGDQLAGVIGALLAGGLPAADAASLGLYLSGRAADIAAKGRSLVPGDVSRALADAISDPGPASSPLALPFVTFDQPPRR